MACQGAKSDLGLLLVRRAIPTLICLLLLVHVAVPVLPSFVCARMAGPRLTHPCCPPEEPPDAPAWTIRCCQPAQAVTLDVQREPLLRSRILSPIVLPLVLAESPALPVPGGALALTSRRDRPPDNAPPSSLRILRI